ncbi:MAG: hypothetical protein EPN55_08570 [Gammaproteobacteria bacterium]|nr:MAG: hypothetical protein EPN55_08570 [Gammaproteobacteria bacterium]
MISSLGFKKQILLAMLTAVVVLLVSFVAGVYYLETRHMAQETAERNRTIQTFYQHELTERARRLGSVMASMQNGPLHAALRARDRASLARATAPLFRELRGKYGITHLYFSDTARVNLLRAHEPGRHGDVIERFTTREAQRRGQDVWGTELGPLGTFTLRYVSPWRENGKVVGFVELGEELTPVADQIRELFQCECVLFIYKRYLDRNEWESGMKMLGRTPHWERYADAVVTYRTSELLPETVDRIMRNRPPDATAPIATTVDGRDLHVTWMALKDAAAREVGGLVLVRDLSPFTVSRRQVVYTVGAFYLGFAALLSWFFYAVLGQLERERDVEQAKLKQQLDELRRFQRVTVGRELRLKELEEENARLKARLDELQRPAT